MKLNITIYTHSGEVHYITRAIESPSYDIKTLYNLFIESILHDFDNDILEWDWSLD